MGSFMTWMAELLHYKHNQRHSRTIRQERSKEISELTKEINSTSEGIKSKVREYQAADDPLAELMRTLRPKRSRRRN